MKKKFMVSESQYPQDVLPLGCWGLVSRKKKNPLKALIHRYQKSIDFMMVLTAITLMFLAGIWAFLIELAEFAL